MCFFSFFFLEQHAFLKSHSTTTKLITLIDELTAKMHEGQKTAAIFLDMEKALDWVWHQGLLHKLLLAGVFPQLTKLIDSFLYDTFFKIKITDHLSLPRNIEACVPQGSCLSPLLYGFIHKRYAQQVEAFQNNALRTMKGVHYFISNKNLLQSTNLLSLQDDAFRTNQNIKSLTTNNNIFTLIQTCHIIITNR